MGDGDKRVLFCTTLDNQIRHFHVPYIQRLRAHGCRVEVASKGIDPMPFCDAKHDIPFSKNPLSPGNIRAFLQLRRLIRTGAFDLVHCHSPSAGALARIAVRTLPRKGRPIVFYTAHGFHFFSGAPVLYWLLVFPLERLLARYTDVLLVMNDEDYRVATTRGFRAGHIARIPGVGVDVSGLIERQTREDREALRQRHGYGNEDFLLFYAAELSTRKNQTLLLRVMEHLISVIPEIRLVLAGRDLLNGQLQAKTKQSGLGEHVDFPGHLDDVPAWLLLSDCVVASSRQEGLAVNLIEAMACACPIIASDTRGHVDLIRHKQNGLLVPAGDEQAFSDAIQYARSHPEEMKKMAGQARSDAVQYDLPIVLKQVENLYMRYLHLGSNRSVAQEDTNS